MANSKIQVSQGIGTNLATHEITESAEQRHLSRTVLNDENGNTILPLTDATFNTAIGEVSVPAYNGTGDSTIISALKGLYSRLAGTLTVKQATLENNFYLASQVIVPTTLTTGLNYFWIRNTSPTIKIMICKIETACTFSGTAAATRSIYDVALFSGVTATTGNTINIAKAVNTNATSIADVKWLPTGGTLTGVAIGSNIIHLSHSNQLTANVVSDRDFTLNPIVLGQNEGIVVRSNGTIVAGSTINFGISWVEM